MKEIALHILDIAENSVRAGAAEVIIGLEQKSRWLKISIADNGKGMDPEELERTADPFYTSRTTRRVGMGIPLFRQHAEMTGGKLELRSTAGEGTVLEAWFEKDHPDRQPLGDLEGCWMLLATMNQEILWGLELETDRGEFAISTREIREELEIEEIGGMELTESLKRLIRNNIYELGFEVNPGAEEN